MENSKIGGTPVKPIVAGRYAQPGQRIYYNKKSNLNLYFYLKFIILFANLCLVHFCVSGQDYYPKYKYQINLESGFKFHIPDYLFGPSLGFSLYNPSKKIGFIIRSDYMISFYRQIEIKDTVGNILQKEKIVLGESILQPFVEIDYTLISIKNYPLRLGVGWGWITGKISAIEGLRLNYPVITVSVKIPIKSKFFCELRSNFPYTFKLKYWNTPSTLSAVPSFAIFYRINFKKKKK